MRASTILCYPAVAHGVQGVFEFPKGVAVEIEACNEYVNTHVKMACLDDSRHLPTSHFFRHGKRFILHWYHARRRAPGPCPWAICVGDIIGPVLVELGYG